MRPVLISITPDSPSSPYSLGTLTAGQTVTETYLINLNRNAYPTNQTLSVATANATNSINNNLVAANSSQIIVVIPALPTSASLVLDKIVSLQQINSTSVIYNIILIAINKGGSNATNVNITDPDSPSSPYSLGTLTAGNSTSVSYTLTYQRNSTDYSQALSSALASGTNSYSGSSVSANSSISTVSIPATTANTQIFLIKNAQYLFENSTSVIYNLSIGVVNSGGVDLTGITVNDSDIGLDTTID